MPENRLVFFWCNVDNFQCIDRMISIRSLYSNPNLSTNGEWHVSNLKPHLDVCSKMCVDLKVSIK